MDNVATDCGAIFEATVFLGHFNELPDPRQAVKVVYPLDEVLLLSLPAVLAGAEAFTDIARVGDKNLALLRRFLNGTPPHDRIGATFAALDAEHFQRCFVARVAAVSGVPEGVIAVDGKTLCRSGHKKGGKAPMHMVSAFAARQRLVLGQVKVAEKSNEIIAIPKLLDMLSIEGAIITIDAMGCQRDIARKIIENKADYVLALKGNQGSLREDVELFATEQKAKGFADTEVSQNTTIGGDHGRIETRTTTVLHAVWPALSSVKFSPDSPAHLTTLSCSRQHGVNRAGLLWPRSKETSGMPCSDDKIPCPFRDLDFETLLADPLTRLVMASDGVTESAMRALLEQTAAARAREIVPPVAGDPPPG